VTIFLGGQFYSLQRKYTVYCSDRTDVYECDWRSSKTVYMPI